MAIRGELVYNHGQDLREVRRKLLFRHAGFLRQSVNDLGSEGRAQLVWRNRLVWTRANPRLHYVSMTTLLELVEQAAKSSRDVTGLFVPGRGEWCRCFGIGTCVFEQST